MCLSPEVDAAMGLVVGAIALDAVHHVREPSQVPLACVPVVLAAHQLIGVFVWWGLDGTVAASVGHAAVYAYLLIAFALPLLIPVAVAAVEPLDRRRHLMERLAWLGALDSLVLLGGVLTGPVSAADGGDHIAYQATLFHGGALTAVYASVILACLLLSSHRYIVVFGVLNLAAVGVLGWLTFNGFISLWCAWAAATSVLIAAYLRDARPVLRPLHVRVGRRPCRGRQ